MDSAIGFQDGIDDALAEIFLGNFYRALGETQNLDAAFEESWHTLQAQPKPTRATGIVLWRAGRLKARDTTGAARAAARPARPAATASRDALGEARRGRPRGAGPQRMVVAVESAGGV